jgi:hypothetical protein
MMDLQMLVVTEQGRSGRPTSLLPLLAAGGLEPGVVRSSSTGLLLAEATKPG